MKTSIGKFLARIRQKLLARSIHREIAHSIFPQLVGEKQCGYPFNESIAELEKLATFGQFDVQLHIEIIERRAKQLPETYGHAFRYLAYRDLNARLKMYLEFLQQCTPHKAPQITARPQVAA